MSNANPSSSARSTTGTLTASIRNPQDHPEDSTFAGVPDGMAMYRIDNEIYVHASAPDEEYSIFNNGLHFKFKNIPNDNAAHTFALPNDASAYYLSVQSGNFYFYEPISGELTVALNAQNKLIGTFHFIGQHGNTTAEITNGEIDLTGFIDPTDAKQRTGTGTGFLRATIQGGPAPEAAFNATDVAIKKSSPFPKPFYIVHGWRSGTDFVQTTLGINIDEGVTDTSFDLATDTRVRVMYIRSDHYGVATAISGRLEFISLPGSGRAAGSVNCMVQKNQETPYNVTMDFDITDNV